MASKKVSWSDINYKKRKLKRVETEQKLKKQKLDEKVKSGSESVIEVGKFETVSTVSIAVPGSILNNAQSPALKTYLCGQIARAACIYQVDEVIVYNDQGEDGDKTSLTNLSQSKLKPCQQLMFILQYLECPQYLRKHLFPIHNYLKYAGVLNPLDAPHHLRKTDNCIFREGVVLTLPPKPGKGSYVDVGLHKPVTIDKILEPYIRVTVKLHPNAYDTTTKKIYGTAVSPMLPKTEMGKYWGYTVRIANSLNEVFTKSPYPKGYDVTIGTSDKGSSIDDMLNFENFNHCLIVFGGVQGLEFALENDEKLNIEDVSHLFDYYINTCPRQACRTIRTEEAILISLAELRHKLNLDNDTSNG